MACKTFPDEALRRAWRDHKKPTWPASFEEAMNDPFYSRLIKAAARAYTDKPTPQQVIRRPTVPAQPTTQPRLDFKRRAAGERDDD